MRISFALSVLIVLCARCYAVAPWCTNCATNTLRMPESSVGMWKITLTKFEGRNMGGGGAAAPTGFILWTGTTIGTTLGSKIAGDPSMDDWCYTSHTSGDGDFARIAWSAHTDGTPDSTLFGSYLGPPQFNNGVAELIYDAASSTSTVWVFKPSSGSLNEATLEAVDSLPWASGGGGADGWTSAQVTTYLQLFGDYVVPAADKVNLYLPGMKGDLHAVKGHLEGGLSEGAKFSDVLLKALYPASGAPFDGSEQSYLQLIAGTLAWVGSDETTSGFFDSGPSSSFPGFFAASPFRTVMDPAVSDYYSWMHGPTVPDESSAGASPLGADGAVTRLGNGFKFRVYLSSLWPAGAGEKFRDVTLDFSQFESVRTVIHTVMLGLFGLFCCGRVWDEFRRQ